MNVSGFFVAHDSNIIDGYTAIKPGSILQKNSPYSFTVYQNPLIAAIVYPNMFNIPVHDVCLWEVQTDIAEWQLENPVLHLKFIQKAPMPAFTLDEVMDVGAQCLNAAACVPVYWFSWEKISKETRQASLRNIEAIRLFLEALALYQDGSNVATRHYVAQCICQANQAYALDVLSIIEGVLSDR